MSTTTVIVVVIALLTVPSFGLADEPSVHPEWEKRVVLKAGQEIFGDYFAFGSHVEISGSVHGDVYAAGGEVLIDGTVDGDVIVAGGKVLLSGHVNQDARVIGGQVTVSGRVDRNASIAGGDVHFTDGAHVQGNVLAGAGNLLLAGETGQDARIGAGNVTVSNKIGGNLAVAAANIRLTSRASVGKHFRYWSEDEPSIDEGAEVLGTISRREIPESFTGERFKRVSTGVKVVTGIVNFVSTLLLGLLLLRVYPVFSQNVAETIHERPWSSVGIGGALLVGGPLLVLLCLVTIVGIPIGIMLGALFLVTLYLARVFVMLWVGEWILKALRGSPSPARAFAAGLFLYSALLMIPLIGGLVTLVTIVIGTGAILIAKKELVETLRKQKVV